MARRATDRLNERIARAAAVLVFALAQLFTAAHAEEDHDDHGSAAHCAICYVACSDDDMDAPPAVGALIPLQAFAGGISIPASRTGDASFDSHSLVRAPPHA